MTQHKLIPNWLLTLMNGQQYVLVPVDAHGSVMEAPEQGDLWTGKLANGGTLTVPGSQILAIEEYEVGHRTNKGIKRETCNRDRVEQVITDNTDHATGEVKNVAYIREKGNPDNSVERKPGGWPW